MRATEQVAPKATAGGHKAGGGRRHRRPVPVGVGSRKTPNQTGPVHRVNTDTLSRLFFSFTASQIPRLYCCRSENRYSQQFYGTFQINLQPSMCQFADQRGILTRVASILLPPDIVCVVSTTSYTFLLTPRAAVVPVATTRAKLRSCSQQLGTSTEERDRN